MDKEFYTIREAAKILNYSGRHLRELCIDGKIEGAYKLEGGRKWLIPRTAVQRISHSQPRQPINQQISGQTQQQDALVIDAKRKHFEQVGSLLERWGENLETARNIGAYALIYDVEEEPLFPYVLQHCPSVSEKYQPFEVKRREFEAKQDALAEQIARESPPEAIEWFSKVAAHYSVEAALGYSLPRYNVVAYDDARSLEVRDKIIAEGSPEAMQRCEELHKELIRKYVDSPEASSLANNAKNLQAMQVELAQAIQDSQLGQEWINNECDRCPGKTVAITQ